MKNLKHHILIVILLLTLGCRAKYSVENYVTGDATNFQVNLFKNNAAVVEPGLHQNFTKTLQDVIRDHTGLVLVNSNADLLYEGEIVEYRISPTTPTTENITAMNRLIITVNVHFINKNKAELQKQFSSFYDYPRDQQLVGDLKATVHEEIFHRLTQEILFTSLDNW
ncbi:LptE family protein [Flavobacteriaceae bacterium MHTCC 0001]